MRWVACVWIKQCILWMDLHFYSAFPVYWPLKGLYSTCHIRPVTHTFIHWWQMLPCKVPTAHRDQIGGSLPCSRTLRHAARGSCPVTLRLLDDLFYLLSYSCFLPCLHVFEKKNRCLNEIIEGLLNLITPNMETHQLYFSVRNYFSSHFTTCILINVQ